MYAGTLYDTAAPSIEVRIYRNDRLLVRETCESREDAAAILRSRPQTGTTCTCSVEGACSDRGPGDVITRGERRWGIDEDQPLASAQLPGYGTE